MARGQLRSGSSADEEAADDLAEAFAAFGLQCESNPIDDPEEFWLWPENEEVFAIWGGLQTQWTAGMAGAIGLNYASVEADLRMMGVPSKKRREYYLLIKHMEQAALEEWASKR